MTGKYEASKSTPERAGKLLILERKAMELTAVEDVVSFDEDGAVLRTSLGMLAVEGEGLHVVKLDLEGGTLLLEGTINGLFYAEAGGAKKRAGRKLR